MLTFNVAVEAAIILVAASAATTANYGGFIVGRDEQLMLWCCLFGLLGGLCSLRFNPPVKQEYPGETEQKQIARLRIQGLFQIIVNMILSVAISPQVVDFIEWSTTGRVPAGIKIAFTVSVAVGIGADQLIARLYPKVSALVESWALGWSRWYAGRKSAPAARRHRQNKGGH